MVAEELSEAGEVGILLFLQERLDSEQLLASELINADEHLEEVGRGGVELFDDVFGLEAVALPTLAPPLPGSNGGLDYLHFFSAGTCTALNKKVGGRKATL